MAAGSAKVARTGARKKWSGSGRPHVDAIAEVRRIEGHDVRLDPAAAFGGDLDLDPTSVP